MTTTQQPERSGGDRVLAWLAIAMMLGVAVMEAALLIPEVLREAHGTWDAINMVCSCIALVLVWLYCLYFERSHLYERKEAKWHRRRGYLMQVIAIGAYTATQIQDKHPAAPAVLVVVVLMAMGVWRTWLSTLALTPEQQAAIDELLDERQRVFKERIADEQRKASEIRFAAVLARYELPNIPAQTVAGHGEPAFAWPIPDGKHRPYVYFVRNGDRVKIGTTTNLRNRISSLSLRTSDIVLLLLGDRRGEQSLHRQFAAQRVGNTEWFHYAGPVAEYVAQQTTEARADQKTKG